MTSLYSAAIVAIMLVSFVIDKAIMRARPRNRRRKRSASFFLTALLICAMLYFLRIAYRHYYGPLIDIGRDAPARDETSP